MVLGRSALGKLERFEVLEQLLSDPEVTVNPAKVREYAKEHAALKAVVECIRQVQQVDAQIQETRDLLKSSASQNEMAQMARSELEMLEARQAELGQKLEAFLVERDPDDGKNVIVEIRAGTGGAEASLFAADLFRMYSRLAVRRSWVVELISSSESEIGGFKEVIFAVEGTDVYRDLKFERGVHRVQRVPTTEASGRIHTSTVSVAVLPQAEEVELQVDLKDLRIDVYRSSGPGGQGVNTTDSAVRITHKPSGLVVTCQDERSQLKNRAKAMKVLRARLLEARDEALASERSRDRRAQIGTGDRSEKIRTYNFPDRRVTDHRIRLTSHQLDEIMSGDLDEFIEAFHDAEHKLRMQAEGSTHAS